MLPSKRQAMSAVAIISASLACGLAAQPQDATKKAADFALLGTIVDESKNPVIGAKVTALGNWDDDSRVTKSGPNGSFHLPLRAAYRDHVPLNLVTAILVEGTKGELGFAWVDQKKPSVQIILKGPAQLAVDVVDGQGKPVAGALCFALNLSEPVAQGQTGVDGRWTARLPIDATDYNWSVFAFKSKAGFDYLLDERPGQERKANLKAASEKRKTEAELKRATEKKNGGLKIKTPAPKAGIPNPKATPPELAKGTIGRMPNQVRLTLDEARTVRVKTVDRDGKAIMGIEVTPWYLNKPGLDRIIFSRIPELRKTTGPSGAAFDWLPATASFIPFVARANDFHSLEISTDVKGLMRETELTIIVDPTERLTGRVTHLDGKPAAGIRILANGNSDGSNVNRFRGSTRTDADGRYSFNAYANETVVVKIAEDAWTAREQRDLHIRAGRLTDGVDFVLTPKVPAAAPK